MKKFLFASLIFCLLLLAACTRIPSLPGDETGKDTMHVTEQPDTDPVQTDPVQTDPVQTDPSGTDGSQPADSDQPTDTESTEEQTTFGPLHFPETEEQ